MQRPFRTTHHPLPLRGFTLVELLVVIAIIGALSAVTMMACIRAKESSYSAREMSGAKNLATALTLHATDNNGRLLVGYDESAEGTIIEDAGLSNPNIPATAMHRYPWRLGSYFGYKFDNTTILSGELNKLVDKQDSYMISVLPSLGMNVYGIGGYNVTGEEPSEGALRSLEAAHSPSSLIAFASAHCSDVRGGNKPAPGFHMVTPRLMPKGNWASSYNEEKPSSWGNLHLRHKNKAAVCFLDGSAALLDGDQLKDMRHWSNQAAIDNNPNYRLPRSSGGRR